MVTNEEFKELKKHLNELECSINKMIKENKTDRTEGELMEDFRTYVTNCLEDENFDLETMEDWGTWREEELERLEADKKR